MNNQPGMGAYESTKDIRTIKHSNVTFAVAPPLKGGYTYAPSEIENQHTVGICTAANFVQNREKANGKKYSIDFQYLLQKKYYDANWNEGSSILVALKVGKKYGLLPASLFTYVTENDRNLPYSKYIAKLQAIPDSEVQRLIGLCVDKIPGYTSVDVTDPQAIALAINESDAGILCRYEVGKEWYTAVNGTVSWNPIDINPLRPPYAVISGHAITDAGFDYSVAEKNTLANTWGSAWCKQGSADVILGNYSPTEAWIVTTYPIIDVFDTNLSFAMVSPKVTNLQNALKLQGFFTVNCTQFFGPLTLLAVIKFQSANGIIRTGFVGPITRAKLNSIYNP